MLKEIAASKWSEVIRQKKEYPLPLIMEQLLSAPPTVSLKRALKKNLSAVAVIAEIKKASPSQGLFRSGVIESCRLSDIARAYESAGASAISVITEKKYFAGCPSHLRSVKEAVGVPVLRKDFIVDEYQIYESRAMGADAVLLITSLLASAELKRFLGLLEELGMTAVVEAGREEDIFKAARAGAEIIGVNNRDLTTMEVDICRTLRWGPYVPRDRVLISESGIYCHEQVKLLKEQAGVDAILVGKSLVTSINPAEKIKELLGKNVFCSC